MAWVDSMRLRRRADKVRAVGWVNLLLAVVWSVIHASDGMAVLGFGVAWAAVILALTHAIAWMVDKHADRVVRR